jgi:hypothetical protein
MANPNNDPLKERRQGKGILLWGFMFTLWTSGCVHTSQHDVFARGGAEALLPKLTSVTVQLLRAQDMGNLPLQIYSLNRPHSFELALSKIQLVIPAEELFLPPDGFTKYENEAAMLNELAARQQSVFGEKHEQGGEGGDYNQSGKPSFQQ